jgi:hypothetical protein
MRLLFAVFSTCFNLTLFLAETWAQPMKLTVSYTGVGPVNLPVVLGSRREYLPGTVSTLPSFELKPPYQRWRLFPVKWDLFKPRRRRNSIMYSINPMILLPACLLGSENFLK